MAIENKDEPTVVIAGGGPCGMLTAILLSDEDLGVGINTIVLERATEPDEWSTKSYTIVLGDDGKSCLERGRCLEAATEIGSERKFVYFFDGTAGTLKKIPKKSSGIGLSRPTLVRCLEDIASKHPRITVRSGAGVSKVVRGTGGGAGGGVNVHLEDGSVILASHAIGADGKWSKVRQSTSELEAQASIKVEPSFGVHMMLSSSPDGWALDGTYIVKPDDKYKFYIIAAPLPPRIGGISVSIVCYDETVELYPWLAPPDDMNSESYGKGGWEDEYSARPDNGDDVASSNLSEQLAALLQEAVPAFYNVIGADDLKTARINRRVSWLDMTKAPDASDDDEQVTYATSDGLVTLLGDAAHAVVPTMGEGCNNALQSAVKLADAILLEMKNNEMNTCTREAISNAFLKYGASRHKEVAPIQVMSAARSRLKKT